VRVARERVPEAQERGHAHPHECRELVVHLRPLSGLSSLPTRSTGPRGCPGRRPAAETRSGPAPHVT
jgi:hypothetical protein